MNRIFLSLIVFVLCIPAIFAWALSVDDLISLKKLGFSESEIKQEIKKSGVPSNITAEDLKKLKDAGFSREFLGNLSQKKNTVKAQLTQQELLNLIEKDTPVKTILETISLRGRNLVGDKNFLKKLEKHAAPYPIILAIRGKPISKEEVLRLAEFGLKKDTYKVLVSITGIKAENLPPSEALKLIKAGVPEDIVRQFKKGRQISDQKSSPLNKTGRNQDVFVEHIQLKKGSFTHIGKKFYVKCPKGWSLLRKIDDGDVVYYFTPEKSPKTEPDTYFAIYLVPRPKDAEGWVSSPVEILQKTIQVQLIEEPGLKVVSKPEKRSICGLKGADVSFEGIFKDKKGRFKGKLYAALDDDSMYLIAAVAPEGSYERYKRDFKYILSNSVLGRHQPSLRGKSIDASELVKKYKKSVVVVNATTGFRGGQGTGFIVSKEGYILTNWHVIWDEKRAKPHDEIYVYWDDSLKLPRKRAKVIGYVRRSSTQVVFGGVDVALLKIEPGDYNPIPLTPVRDVELGDEIITLGYPRSDIVSGYSLFVTKGVVVRFNRDLQGNVESISIDAKITHGNSGGPCISLKTGGAIGITTGGIDIGSVGEEGESLNDLVGYNFVFTSDSAAKQFPLVLELGIKDEKSLTFLDYYELSKLYSIPGTGYAALNLADKALKLNKNEYSLTQKALALVFVATSSLTYNPKDALDKIKEAVSLLKEALTINSKYQEALSNLVNILLEIDKKDEAEKYAKRYVSIWPNDWESHLLLAQIYLAKGQKEEAKRELNESIKFARHLMPEPYILAGFIAYGENKPEEGRKFFKIASEILPSSLEARMGVISFYELKNEWKRALKGYEKLLADFPRNPFIFYRMGICHNKLHNEEKALYYYGQSLSSFKKRGIIPPGDLLLEIGDICQKNFKNPRVAIKFYTMFLLYHWEDENAIKVHAKLATLINNQGVATAHVRAAYAMAKMTGQKFEAQNFQYKDLSIEDIVYMLSQNYPPPVAANLILNTRLDFQIRSKSDLEKIIKKYKLPFVVLKAILKANDTQQAPVNNGQPNNQAPPAVNPPLAPEPIPGPQPNLPSAPNASSWLIGQWSASLMIPGAGLYQENITLNADGTFLAQYMLGYYSEVAQGRWSVEGNVIHLRTTQGEDINRIFRKIGPNVISVFLDEMQAWVTYKKIQ